MFSKYIFIIVSFVSFFIYAYFSRNFELPIIIVSKQASVFNFKSKVLKTLSFGNERLISSLLWITTMIESDIEQYKKKDSNSWLFLRFDTITDLHSKFYNAYKWGGLYLSVVKDDDIGAEIIYKKGLKEYPNDFILNFQYGFHAYAETGKINEAIIHFEKVLADDIGKQKYMVFLPSLLAKLKASENSLSEAFNFLLEIRSSYSNNQFLYDRFSSSLYAIRAEIDLGCLNSKKESNCRTHDFYGKPYLKLKNGQYFAQQKWERFGLKK